MNRVLVLGLASLVVACGSAAQNVASSAPLLTASVAPTAAATSSPVTSIGPIATSTGQPILSGPAVTGKVVVSASGAAVAGGQVAAFTAGTGCFARVSSASVDAVGSYLLRVPAGTYCIQFIPPTGSGLAPQWWKGAKTLGAVTELAVSGVVDGVDAALAPGFTIAGRITSAGAPFAGAAVYANTTPGSNFYAAAFAVSDATGGYRLTVPQGTYYVRIVATAKVYYWNGAAPVVAVCPCAPVAVGPDRLDITASLP